MTCHLRKIATFNVGEKIDVQHYGTSILRKFSEAWEEFEFEAANLQPVTVFFFLI